MEAAKFNLQYVVAQSLANGVPKLAHFEPDAIKDERVKALAQMVAVAIDPEFADAHRGLSDAGHGDAEGRPHRRGVASSMPSGTAKNPMSAAQMREKFFDCAAHAGVERPVAEKIAAVLDRLGEQPSFDEFWPLHTAPLKRKSRADAKHRARPVALRISAARRRTLAAPAGRSAA